MKHYYLFALIALLPIFSFGQVVKTSDLYPSILINDSLIFEVGFNKCDINQFENLLSDSFKFFHDKDSISDKSSFLRSLRKGLCGSPETYQSRRELVKASTEIYPLYKNEAIYGAIQTGTHKFYEKIADKKEVYASTAKFTHVWILEGGKWKLNTSLSYDHQTGMKQIPAN